MKLSMQNIADWFIEHGRTVQSDIKNDVACLENVKWLSDDCHDPAAVYVEPNMEPEDERKFTTIVSRGNSLIRIFQTDPDAVFNEVIYMFEYFGNWGIRLYRCLLERKPLSDIVAIGDEVFKAPTIICGVDGNCFALTENYGPEVSPLWRSRLENDLVSYETIREYALSDYFRRLHDSTYPSLNNSPIAKGKTLNANLYYRGQRKGIIVTYEYMHTLRPGYIHYMNFYARLVEKYLAFQEGKFFSLNYLEHFLFLAVSGQTRNWDKLEKTFGLIGWKTDDTFEILCIGILTGDREAESFELEYLASRIRERERHLCIFFADNGKLLVILDNKGVDIVCRDVAGEVSGCAKSPVRIGISNEFRDIRQIKQYFKQAKLAMTYAGSKRGNIIPAKDILTEELKKIIFTDDYSKVYVHPAITAMGIYDKEHGTDLLPTLKCYLMCGCNFTDAAAALFVHRNTVIKKIDKISADYQLNLSDQTLKNVLLYTLVLLL